MFCAAVIQAPMTRIVEEYRKESGVSVQLQFGGSGTLLGNLQIAPGDLYLAADSTYTDEAAKRGLIGETFPVATITAGFGVPRGNPKNLTSLTDLNREKLRTAIGNPNATSIGRLTRDVLTRHDSWKTFEPTVSFPTVTELANVIKLNTVDLVIIWDAVAQQYPEIDFIPLSEFEREPQQITIGVAEASRQPAAAAEFCRFLTSEEEGARILLEEGYAIADSE